MSFIFASVSVLICAIPMVIFDCASLIFLLIASRSGFCESLRSLAPFSSLKNDLLEFNNENKIEEIKIIDSNPRNNPQPPKII